MRFEVDGLPSYAYTGSRPLAAGQPAVVFIHGGGLDHSVWIHQSRYFAHHGFNAVALDLPGHGRSGGNPLGTIPEMAHWTMSAADALGIERLYVAGHSMGSLVALETSGLYPDRVDAAALVGCAVPMAVTGALLDAAKANAHAAFDMITLWGHRMGAQLGGNPSPGMWMTGGGVRLLERSRPGVLHNDLSACNEYRHGLDTAANITCPVHLLIGREDVMAPPRATRELIAALSVVRVVELADCGHMLMAEQPDAVRDALIAAFPAPTAPSRRPHSGDARAVRFLDSEMSKSNISAMTDEISAALKERMTDPRRLWLCKKLGALKTAIEHDGKEKSSSARGRFKRHIETKWAGMLGYSAALKYAKIGQSPDPEKALEEHKAKDRKSQTKKRESERAKLARGPDIDDE